MARAPTLKPRLPLLATGGGRVAVVNPATVRTRGAAWMRIRQVQLMREPLCRACAGAGLTTAACEVDHIRPLYAGGTDDADNLQSLCTPCHAAKTRIETARRYAP